MHHVRPSSPLRRAVWGMLLVLPMAWCAPTFAADTETKLAPLPKVFEKLSPTSLDDLKAIQSRVQEVVKKVMPAVVNVRIGAGQGSGVIISEDGYILTAGHVSGAAGRKVRVTLPDGKQVWGKTLGANRIVDSGLVKITEKGKWPHVDIGNSAKLDRGDWCMAIGHPGGYRPGRDPVVRLGRVLDNMKELIRTDCTLVGGDSGGPLFDMDGNVIAIHSRIGFKIDFNIHVPAKQYKDDWERLVKGDVIYPGYLGVKRDPDAKNCKVLEIVPKSAADKAGIKANDVITKFNGKNVGDFDDLIRIITPMRSGDTVAVEVQREDETVMLEVVLGERK